MLTSLINPKTPAYQVLKDLIHGETFSWFYLSQMTKAKSTEYGNYGFYSHTFLERPWNNMQKLFPEVRCGLMEHVQQVIVEIAAANGMQINCLLRVNANCVEPVQEPRLTTPHYDHDFPHQNLLIYLDSAGGETVVFGESQKLSEAQVHTPSEDDVILFSGLHCYRPSSTSRRKVLVATFI